MSKWDNRYIELAKHIAHWRAAITDSSNRLISVGYNGLAKGVEDTAERLNNRELFKEAGVELVGVECFANSLPHPV